MTNIRHFNKASRAEQTDKNYTAHQKRWMTWCREHDPVLTPTVTPGKLLYFLVDFVVVRQGRKALPTGRKAKEQHERAKAMGNLKPKRRRATATENAGPQAPNNRKRMLRIVCGCARFRNILGMH